MPVLLHTARTDLHVIWKPPPITRFQKTKNFILADVRCQIVRFHLYEIVLFSKLLK